MLFVSFFLCISGQGVIASLGLGHCFGRGLEYWVSGICTSIEVHLYIALLLEQHRQHYYCLGAWVLKWMEFHKYKSIIYALQ